MSREKRRASKLASSSRSPTSRSSLAASVPMIVPARAGSGARPSVSASAKPRIDVSGVRRSWDTDSRNWRSMPRERSRLAAIALIDRARPASSEPSACSSGTRTERSPAAIRLVASWASRRGRVRRRPRLTATATATGQGGEHGDEEPRPQRRPGRRPRCGSGPRRGSRPAAPARPRRSRPPAGRCAASPARSASTSTSWRGTPGGSWPRRLPSGPSRSTPAPSSRRARTTTVRAPGAWTVSTWVARRTACRRSSVRAWCGPRPAPARTSPRWPRPAPRPRWPRW